MLLVERHDCNTGKAVVTTIIRLRFDFRSTPVRLQFYTTLRPFDDLRYGRAAALRPK